MLSDPSWAARARCHGSFRVRERRAGLLNEDTPCIREFHNSSLISGEQVKSMLGFQVGNLFAERRLGYMQSVRGPPEVQLFAKAMTASR